MRRILPGLAAILLLLTACAPASRAPKTAADLPKVEVKDLEVRALLLLLVDRQSIDSFVVQQALKGDAALREELAASLGRIPDPEGRGALEGLLIDDVPAVRRAAAFSLGVLGDPEAQGALYAAVRDPDRETGTLAVEALGKLKARAVDVLEALLTLPEPERWARLLPSLFRFKEETVVSIGERGLAAAADPALHADAAYALCREPRPSALPTLRKLLADPDPRVRAWAARAISLVGSGDDLALLRPLLDDAGPDPGPVIQALRAARAMLDGGKAKPIAEWTPRLRALLADPRPGVRASALDAAGVWGSPELGDLLVIAAGAAGGGDPREPWERGEALVALAAGRHPRALELATAAADSKDDALRTRAAEAAGALAGPAASALLGKLAADPSARVRGAALGARLDDKTSDDQAKTAIARQGLQDSDPAVRGGALGWLEEHPVLPLADLGAALPAVYRDATAEEGLAAVRAVAARTEKEPRERGEGVALLEKLAAGGPYVLRRQAGESLVKLGRPAPRLEPAVKDRPLDVYRAVVQRTRRPRTVEIRTRRGTITVRLACPEAPLTCLNFLNLAGEGFYDGLSFHRVAPDFVIQGGDPRGDGSGGPGYVIRDEINRLRYRRGAVGMALAGPDTGGSQFFITLSPQPHLDGGYTVFGEVIAGEAVLDQIRLGDRIEKVLEVVR